MIHALRTSLALIRLFAHEDRRSYEMALLTGIAVPLTIAYLGSRLSSSGVDAGVIAIGTTLVFNLGMTQVGSLTLADRFTGRLALLRTSPVGKSAYLLARQTVGVIETTLVVSFVMGLLILADRLVWSAAIPGFALSTILASSSLCGLAAVLTARARDYESGWTLVSLAALGGFLLSPVLYPEASVPAYLRPLSWLSPYTHIPPQVLALVSGDALPWPRVAASAAMALLLNAASYRMFRW